MHVHHRCIIVRLYVPLQRRKSLGAKALHCMLELPRHRLHHQEADETAGEIEDRAV
jgi:hypothetical protein